MPAPPEPSPRPSVAAPPAPDPFKARSWAQRLRVALAPLSVRIWLAVVLTQVVLLLLVGWAWRLAAEPPWRDVVVRDTTGRVVGRGMTRHPRMPSADASAPMHMGHPMGASPMADRRRPGRMRPDAGPGGAADRPWPPLAALPGAAQPGPGAAAQGAPSALEPEFDVRLHDGQTLRMHLTRAPASIWTRPPFGFAWLLVWVGLAVALGTYPIVRRLTRRLEGLQAGVQRWGEGDLTVRVAQDGNDEVAFLAQRFNHAAERIQALVQSQDALLASQKSLLANASHELRSPLARIRMGLELMGAGAPEALRAELRRNVAELDALIDEILLASRLDAQEADLGTIEAVDVLGLLAEECARTGATLEVQGAAPADGWQVSAVAKLLRRALRNLLENARRYAPGEVSVTVRALPDAAELAVCDRGPGVPEALRERIFEPFFRLPGASERDGGVGLGLALVRAIAQRHGGQVACQARAGGGACFILRWPWVPSIDQTDK